MRRPSARKNSQPSSQTGPRVSKAKGTKVCVAEMAAYLACFDLAACSAAAPARAAVLGKCDGASVSATVASQAKHLPEAHGIMVTPSGLLPSLDINSLGSLTEGTSQLAKAR